MLQQERRTCSPRGKLWLQMTALPACCHRRLQQYRQNCTPGSCAGRCVESLTAAAECSSCHTWLIAPEAEEVHGASPAAGFEWISGSRMLAAHSDCVHKRREGAGKLHHPGTSQCGTCTAYNAASAVEQCRAGLLVCSASASRSAQAQSATAKS